MKEVARGTAAIACLPSKDDLSSAYVGLQGRIDQIVSQAQQEGSLTVAISGLNSIRHTLDSMMRLAGHDRPLDKAQANAAAQAGVNFDLAKVAERLTQAFDHEPELKARIAKALLEIDDEQQNLIPAQPLDDSVEFIYEHGGGAGVRPRSITGKRHPSYKGERGRARLAHA